MNDKIEQAFEILWNGGFIRVNDLLICITDILNIDVLESQSKAKSEKQVFEYLQGKEFTIKTLISCDNCYQPVYTDDPEEIKFWLCPDCLSDDDVLRFYDMDYKDFN